MNRTGKGSRILAAAAAAMLCISLWSYAPHGGQVRAADRDLYVGYGDKAANYATVQAAVNAAAGMQPKSESERITIHIAPGIYREQIQVNTPYLTFQNDAPAQGDVLLTWYYGIGYKYYSVGSDGYYQAAAAAAKTTKTEPTSRWGCCVYLRSNADYFRASGITFENSFNRYVTNEERADGVEPSGSQSITYNRTASGADVRSKAATERAAALCTDGDRVEFYQCNFLGSQDTLYTGSGTNGYFKDCMIQGNTDYIFGSGNYVFDACELQFYGYSAGAVGGYITAAREQTMGYLFQNCRVTANSGQVVNAGYFGRPWMSTAHVAFLNTKVQKSGLLTDVGWTSMSGNTPESATFREYGSVYDNGSPVYTGGRTVGTVLSAEQAAALQPAAYLGDWTPYFMQGGDAPADGPASVIWGAHTTPVDNAIYCAPNGTASGSGSKESPMDVETAISKVAAGQTIYLLEGTYRLSSRISIPAANSGTANAYKTIAAYPGTRVVLDFSAMSVSGSNQGFAMGGSYWHWYGFEITGAGDNGMLLGGSYNLLERMLFTRNQDSGLQISRTDASQTSLPLWPANNLILNCTSCNNCDAATMENADGFAAKLTCGEGNVFDGCMSYNNSDDGWDLYAKTETGPIGVVTLQNCVAFRNGYTESGDGYGDCDGNGFKLGGSGVGTAHVVRNCLAFENYHGGFTDNNNPLLGSLTGCTAYNNGMDGSSNFKVYRCTNCRFGSLLSYFNDRTVTKREKDAFTGTISDSVYYADGSYYAVGDAASITTAAGVGSKINAPGDNDFVSVISPAMGTDFHTVWRAADGSLSLGGFLALKADSPFVRYGFRQPETIPVEPPVSGSWVMRADTLMLGTYTADYRVNDCFTLKSNGGEVVVLESAATTADQRFRFTQAVRTGGRGDPANRSLEIQAGAAGKLTAYVASSSTLEDRTLQLLDASGTVLDAVVVSGTTLAMQSFSIPAAGTYYLASAGSSLHLYYAAFATDGAAVEGDINGDGQCSVADAVLLQKFLLCDGTLTQAQADIADLVPDHKLNALDLTALKRRLLQA